MLNHLSISQEFREYLEEVQASWRRCTIKFRLDTGAVTTVQVKIQDFQREGETEYLVIDNGFRIRFDQLIEVDGKPAQYLA